MTARLLLVAKAPVVGHAKTRLGVVVGMEAAAELAAAALLDTIEVAAASFPGSCHLALAGDLGEAVRAPELREALDGWHVFDQVGDGFGARLAHAHLTVAERDAGPVVQIGMDTPQLRGDLLHESAALVEDGTDAVLGPAEDGGWWLLALADARRAAALTDVPMSDPCTYEETVRALAAPGSRVREIAVLRDVDELDDATAVAAAAPGTRFAAAWRSCARVPS